MPVCPNCGVAYVDGESHDCRDGVTMWRAVKVVLITIGATFIALAALVILVFGICAGALTM
jgi:hypothetical protein